MIGPNITLLLIAVNLFLCLLNQVIGQYGLAILNIVAAGFLILHLHYLDDEDQDDNSNNNSNNSNDSNDRNGSSK